MSQQGWNSNFNHSEILKNHEEEANHLQSIFASYLKCTVDRRRSTRWRYAIAIFTTAARLVRSVTLIKLMMTERTEELTETYTNLT